MRTLQKIISMLILVCLLTTDFSILGIGLKSYAANNTENIEFSAYFIDQNGNKLEKINQEVTNQELKLHLTISVKNEGYFNGSVKIEDSNFKIKTDEKIENNMIAELQSNSISLKQINAGTNVNIDLPIEVVKAEEIATTMLAKEAILKLEGTYMKASAKAVTTEMEKKITLNIVPSKDVNVELDTNVITNTKTLVGENNKRVVQLFIKSRVANNEYPASKTTINIQSPFKGIEPEKVDVIALKTTATNNEDTKVINDITNDNGTISFSIENKENENKIIKWKKDAFDEFVVTFIYDENVEVQNSTIADYSKIKTEANIILYNVEKSIQATSEANVNEEKINTIILNETSSKTSMYKGKLYANITSYYPEEIPYMDTTKIYLTESDIFDSIVLTEDEEKFVAGGDQLSSYSLYKTTQVNKAQVLDILGEDGELSIIYDGNIFKVNKDTETNEAGNIILTYNNEVKKVGIITTKPVKAGKLEFIHTKVLQGSNGYTREQLKQVTSMQNTISVAGIQGKTELATSDFTRNIELKETETKAELTIVDSKGSLSTLKDNKVVLGVKLVTDGEQYDLFKNTILKIKLPDEVEDFELTNADKLYAEGFSIMAGYDKTNKIIALALAGEQTDYPETLATQIYLQLELTLKLSKTAPSKLSKISMEYTNENATKYYGQSETVAQTLETENSTKGYVEQEIEISSPTGVVLTLNSSTYGVETMTMVNSESKTIEIAKNQAGTDLNFDFAVINNTQTDMKNAKILVQLPTCGQKDIDTLKTKLKNIEVNGAKIYYTQNENATVDVTNVSNNWKTDLDADSKKVLIVLNDTLAKASSFLSKITLTLPEEIPMNVETELKYKTIYDTDSEQNVETESNSIKIVTPKEIKMETTISATTGGKELKSGDKVKVGEVVKYAISVKNIGSQTIRNVTLKGDVPTGTALLNDSTQTTFTIDELKANETYVKTYEVKINEKVNEILNKATAICDTITAESSEMKNSVEEAKLSVVLEQEAPDQKSRENGDETEYTVQITNLTNQEIKDVEFSVNNSSLKLTKVRIENENYNGDLEKAINVSSIPANETIYIKIIGNINTESDKITTTVSVKDKNGEIYNSNEVEEQVFKENATIELICSQENNQIDQGSYVRYRMLVTNTGTMDTQIRIQNQISEYIKILELTAAIYKEDDSIEIPENNYANNKFDYSIFLKAGSKITIDIIGMVQTIAGEEFKLKEISDIATINVNGTEIKSEETKFYIKGIDGQNYNIDNSDDNSGDNNNNNNNNGGNNDSNKKYSISGIAWLDENSNGQREDSEKVLSGIKVKVYDVATNNYLKNSNGQIIETTTGDDGKYQFDSIPEGQYILLFEYDSDKYELTSYKADGLIEGRKSSVVLKTINVNGENLLCGVTDTIYLDWDTPNINIGLKEKKKFDLELNKYISKIVVQNSKGTKSYDFKNKNFAKVEIDRKQLKNSTVIIEYNIQVKNTGDVEGYVSTIVDYMPAGMTFRSELNSNWYLIDGNLYTKELEKVKLQPGETREINLVLTKQMNEENVGLVNNIAEISEDYNEYGIADIDSVPNNKITGEDDLGSADVYIAIGTGAKMIAYVLLAIVNVVLIGSAITIILIKRKK